MMNTTAVISADHGGLSAQQKAAKLVYLMVVEGWNPTTNEIAETFAMCGSSAYQMICRVSGVVPIYREDARPGEPGRWKTFDNV